MPLFKYNFFMLNRKSKTVKIGERFVGPEKPVFVIAEIANNHNGSMENARKLIDVAHTAGADAVKFQKRTLEEIYQKEYLDNPNKGEHGLHYMLPVLKKYELTMSQMRELAEYCQKKNIMFLVTPWDKTSVDFVDSLNVDFFKVSSADMTNLDLIEYMISKKKPLIISTGMSSEQEVMNTIKFLEKKKANYVILHCNSTYPAPLDLLNLRYMDRLKELTDAPVGYSGHETGIAMGPVAVAAGATVLERHITLDKRMEGPDHKASLEPEELKQYIHDVRLAEIALGTKKKVFSRGEFLNWEVLGKSIAAKQFIKKGQKITKNMVQIIGPGKGLSPQRINEVVGKTAKRDYAADEFFTEEFLPLPKNIDSISPFKWGLKGRFDSVDELYEKWRPDLFEFHMTDEDARSDWQPKKKYEMELILHATEYLGHRMLDMCNDDAEYRNASIKSVQDTIDKARSLAGFFRGVPAVIVHAGGMSIEPHDDEKTKKKLLDNLKISLEKVDMKDVKFYLENIPPRPWYFGGQWTQNVFHDGWEIATFLKETGYDFCFDISHAKLSCNVMRKNLNEYAKIVQPWTQHLHVADAAGFDGEGLQIGEGEVDFPGLFEIIKKKPCSLVPEVWRGHLYHARGFILGMKKIEKLLNK